MRRILLATASTIAISTSAAMAADLGPMPTKAAAPIPAPLSWTGGYVGLNAGYAWGNADGTIAAGSVFTPADLNVSSLRPKGFIGGGQVGLNWQTGPWVLGGEVDFTGMSVKADRSVNPFFVGKGTP